MSIKAGLVGLPNVGKSTLFNALTRSSIPAENYPFCTIEPHTAITPVPDRRIENLQKIFHSQTTIPTTVTFTDIAGLVKGAASGEGLGNQFLSHIREVDLIIHVLRCFEDPDIISSREMIDPLEDYHIIITELMLKDLEAVEKRLEKTHHLIKSSQNKPAILKELQQEQIILNGLDKALNTGNISEVHACLKNTPPSIPLLSAKPYIIVANVGEHDLEQKDYLKLPGYTNLINFFGPATVIPTCIKLEQELTQLSHDDALSILSLYDMTQPALDTIIQTTYKSLNLITFFTCGPKEIHSWSIAHETTVRSAAGTIHSDLERGFIRAAVYNYNDLIIAGSEQALTTQGKIRTEGQDYIVQDGDIIHVRFNV